MSTNEEILKARMAARTAGKPAGDASPTTTTAPAAAAAAPTQSYGLPADLAIGVAKDLKTGIIDEGASSVWNGLAKGVNEMTSLAKPLAKKITDVVGDPGYIQIGGDHFISWHREARTAEDKTLETGTPYEQPKSVTGGLIENIAQMAPGLLVAGEILAPIKEAVAVGRAAKVAFTATEGALGEMATFDSQQKRLSNLIAEHSDIMKPVAQYLAADPNDSLAEAKMKQGLEGLFTGVAFEGLVGLAKVVKKTSLFTTAADHPTREVALSELTKAVDEAPGFMTKAGKETRWQVVEKDDSTFIVHDGKTTKFPKEVQRFEEPGVAPGTTDKPHGLYTSPADTQSPHAELGGDRTVHQTNPNANVLEVPNGSSFETNRGTVTYPSSGVSALEHFIGTDETQAFLKLKKEAAVAKIKELYPEIDATKYHDTYELAEVYGAQKAKEAGFDAMHMLDNGPKLPGAPAEDFTEFVGLNEKAFVSKADEALRTFPTRADAEADALGRNLLDREATRAQTPGSLKPDQIEAVRSKVVELLTSNDPATVAKVLESADFNYLKMSNQEDAQKVLSSLSTVARKEIDAARGGAVVTHKELLANVKDMLEGDPEENLANLSRVYKNTQDLAAHLVAGKIMMASAGKKVAKASMMADGAPNSGTLMARLGASIDELFSVTAQVKSIQTNAARATEAGKIDIGGLVDTVGTKPNVAGIETGQAMNTLERELQKVGPQALKARKILASLDGMTPKDMRDLARRIRMAEGDPTSILKIVKGTQRVIKKPAIAGSETAADLLLSGVEYWKNGLLSGPVTQVANIASNTVKAFVQPLEVMNAGRGTYLKFISGNRVSNPRLRQQGWDMLVGNFMNLREDWRMAGKAFRTASSVIDGGLSKAESYSPRIGGYIGKLINLPSRLAVTADEFFKQMTYRSNIRANTLSEARQLLENGHLKEEDFGNYVTDAMDAAFSPDGRGLNKTALNYAQESTFTRNSPDGSLVSHLQQYSHDHPLVDLILPFKQTPADIFQNLVERTPGIRRLSAQVRAELAAGGERKAIAEAKLGTGMALWATGTTLAAMGVITGQGASDPALRAQQIQSGFQPYSFNFPGHAPISFRRGDPFMTPFGIMADIVAMSGEIHQHHVNDVAATVIASLSANFISKQYLAGVSGFMDVLTSGSGTQTHNWLANEYSTLVPSFFNQTNPDSTMRDARSYADRITSHMPGFSETLDPRFNFLGEPVLKAPGWANRAFNPFTIGMGPLKGDGTLENRLLELGKALPTPKREIAPDVDLTDKKYGTTKEGYSMYARLFQLMGNPPGRPSLRDALDKEVMSKEWADAPEGSGVRFEKAKDIVGQYRMNAERLLLQENKNLAKAVKVAQVTAKAKKKLGDNGVSRILDLFKTK